MLAKEELMLESSQTFPADLESQPETDGFILAIQKRDIGKLTELSQQTPEQVAPRHINAILKSAALCSMAERFAYHHKLAFASARRFVPSCRLGDRAYVIGFRLWVASGLVIAPVAALFCGVAGMDMASILAVAGVACAITLGPAVAAALFHYLVVFGLDCHFHPIPSNEEKTETALQMLAVLLPETSGGQAAPLQPTAEQIQQAKDTCGPKVFQCLLTHADDVTRRAHQTLPVPVEERAASFCDRLYAVATSMKAWLILGCCGEGVDADDGYRECA